MKITAIQSTPHIVHPGGLECRVWIGRLENGAPCLFLVHRIATPGDLAELEVALEAELEQRPNPEGSTERTLQMAADARALIRAREILLDAVKQWQPPPSPELARFVALSTLARVFGEAAICREFLDVFFAPDERPSVVEGHDRAREDTERPAQNPLPPWPEWPE